MKFGDLALGMIETFGYPSLIAAADASAKAAHVRVIAYEGADAGIFTVYIVGDVASVRSALTIGEAAAKAVGNCRAARVIARPDHSVYALLPDLNENNSDEDALRAKRIGELRSMARSFELFPLTRREIARAKKEELVQLLMRKEVKRNEF